MSKRWKIGLTAALALTVIAAIVAFATSDGPADLGDVENNIATDIEQQTGANNVTVDCPSVEWEAGQDFRCTAEASRGTSALVTVYMETDDGDYTWEMR